MWCFRHQGFSHLSKGRRGVSGFLLARLLGCCSGAELGRMASERLGAGVGPKSVLCPPPTVASPDHVLPSICGGTRWNVWCGILQFFHQPTRGGGCVVTGHSFLSGRSWRPGRVPVAEERGWGLTPDLSEGLSGWSSPGVPNTGSKTPGTVQTGAGEELRAWFCPPTLGRLGEYRGNGLTPASTRYQGPAS